MTLAALPLFAHAFALLSPQDPTSDVLLGPHRSRHESVVVAMPWPRGMHADVETVRIGEAVGMARTLLRWPDGSVAVSLLHARWEIGASLPERATVEVLDGDEGAAIARRMSEAKFALGELPGLVCGLRDPYGQELTASLDFSRDRVALVARECRVPLTRGDARSPQQLFHVRAWLREYRGCAFAELTVLLENDPSDGEVVFGPARYRSFELTVADPSVSIAVRHAGVLGIGDPTTNDRGEPTIALVPDGPAHYLGDHTGKAFRIELRRQTDRALDPAPLVALADTDWVRHTRAFNAFGGPAPNDATDLRNAEAVLSAFADHGSFGGPYDSYGDAKDPSRDPSRTAPASLHSVLRWRSLAMLDLAGLAVMQHCLRPTPFTSPRLPENTSHLRLGLGPIAIESPHAFRALDYEHFAVDLLFDRYWLTGDPLAQHELRRAGSALLDGLRRVEFRTSRGEGLALRSGVAIARATNDPALLDALHRHARESLLPLLLAAPRGCAIVQPPHDRAMGPHEPFDAIEQMAMLAIGLIALGDAVGDPDIHAAAIDVVRRIATDGWIENEGPAAYVSAREYRERTPPGGDAARTGLLGVLSTAFTLAVELEMPAATRRLLESRLADCFADRAFPGGDATLADPWFQVPRDRR